MIRIFTFLLISLFHQALQAQIVNGGFETIKSSKRALFWAGKTYSFQVVIDSNGVSHADSVVFNKVNYSFTDTKVHSGQWALELRNGYNFTKGVSLPGVAFASADTSEYFTFTNTYIPVTSNPDALKFFCSFIPQNNDTGFATIRVFDAMMNEIGSGTYAIDKALLTYQEIIVPVDYITQADAAYVQVQFSSAQEGGNVSLGTVMYVDDVSVVNLTAMTNDWLLNPINVYPNPSSGNVKLTVKNSVKVSEVFLVDMGGQVIPVKSGSEGVYWTDNLNDGIYIVVAKGTSLFYKYKLVVKR